MVDDILKDKKKKTGRNRNVVRQMDTKNTMNLGRK